MSKNAIIGIVAAILVLAVVFGFWVTNKETEQVPVRITYKATAGYQQFFVAQEKGYFEELGLTIEPMEFESTNQMLEAVVAGRADVTSGSSTEVLALVEQNSPDLIKVFLVIYWTPDNPYDFVLVKKDSEISSLAELEGKQIGTLPGSTATSWLKIILNNFFDPKLSTIMELSPRLQIQALIAGQVQALYTVEPLVSLGESKGVTKVISRGPINQYLMDKLPAGGAVLSTAFLKKHPKLAQKVVQAFYKAVDFIRTNPQETKQIIAKYTKLDREVTNRLEVYQFWKLNEIEVTYLQQYLDHLTENNILTKKIDVSNLILVPEEYRLNIPSTEPKREAAGF